MICMDLNAYVKVIATLLVVIVKVTAIHVRQVGREVAVETHVLETVKKNATEIMGNVFSVVMDSTENNAERVVH